MNFSRVTNIVLFIACVSLQLLVSCSSTASADKEVQSDSSGVAILLVDTDHSLSTIDEDVYGHFLEHINHSVEDGLYAEQVQGQGFEGKDFETHWKPVEKDGKITLVDIPFEKGLKSVRISPGNGTAGVSQERLYVKKDTAYNGSLWLKPETGKPELQLRIRDKNNNQIATAALPFVGTEWQEVKLAFTPSKTDTSAVLEI